MSSGITFAVTPENKAEDVYIYVPDEPATDHYLSNFHEYRSINGTSVLQSTQTNQSFVPTSNGFVDAVIRAYNQHHDLIIRPDDIWLAIMLQFSRFVNANAESIRSKFVSHEGQKELEIRAVGSLKTVDYGLLAKEMANLMHEHIIDEAVCDWVKPSFSTTTDNDRIVGSIVLMTAMQKYFTYKMSLMCGIPNMTILGTVQDWEDIQQRVKKLEEYGPELAKWSAMLSKILDELVNAARGNVNVEFFQRICHYTSTGSGPRYISGWLSAFAVFTEKGEWQGDTLTVTTWTGETIDGLEYPVIKTEDIPAGYATVPVKVDDNGTEYKCTMFVGHTGFDVVNKTGVQPKLTWAMVVNGA
ncbi:hypothetical protein BCR33DRAFT_718462 [Rhizoclosmatium globosum]|uniref:DUF4419 domain-containing protein n=1 Tax=Rhizoclosmatium globosum TaxID=329046 RepID=A0A1Y2C5Y9_9FUNG|nr:hypothetical protein BCR33DRAFT_718462 [Rhizoclosmatium globosum]|eukprot:ORY42294.1 hypothetical protein BCR33DRAFT_718462 [Rhizoclosmatium globosum]